MSKKLLVQIQTMKGMPGKHKRILLALAERARNDGTNIFESKETYGGKAGVSRWTVYRNLDDLVKVGIVVEAQSHECRNDGCPKGSRHYPRSLTGHWTQPYNIDLAALQNATSLLKGLCSKTLKAGRSKMPNVDVAKCDAIQEDYPRVGSASAGSNPEPSALTSGSERASKPFVHRAAPASQEDRGGTPPAPPVALGDGSEEKPENQNAEEFREWFYTEGAYTHEGILLCTITPQPSMAAAAKGLELCRRILAHSAFEAVDDDYKIHAADMVLRFNRVHRGQKYATKQDRLMYIRTPEQYLKALESENAALINDYLTHDYNKCELCTEGGVMGFHRFIQELRQAKVRREEEKLAAARRAEEEEVRRKEEERRAKLCARCKKYPHGSMSLEQGRDYLNNAIMVKVCDGCYDGAYEVQQSGRMGLRVNVLDKRPGYAPPKFDTSAATPELRKAFGAWFTENGKVGDWTTNKEERAALGVSDAHVFGVLRYMHKNQEKVTRDQFVALLLECAFERPNAAQPEPMAMYAAGDVL